jgi:hypothetical protein
MSQHERARYDERARYGECAVCGKWDRLIDNRCVTCGISHVIPPWIRYGATFGWVAIGIIAMRMLQMLDAAVRREWGLPLVFAGPLYILLAITPIVVISVLYALISLTFPLFRRLFGRRPIPSDALTESGKPGAAEPKLPTDI